MDKPDELDEPIERRLTGEKWERERREKTEERKAGSGPGGVRKMDGKGREGERGLQDMGRCITADSGQQLTSPTATAVQAYHTGKPLVREADGRVMR